ncbi:UNVERIFIED_CONTAM: hypothetical protein K2H54_066088, partial [Gekko kuhli]
MAAQESGATLAATCISRLRLRIGRTRASFLVTPSARVLPGEASPNRAKRLRLSLRAQRMEAAEEQQQQQ